MKSCYYQFLYFGRYLVFYAFSKVSLMLKQICCITHFFTILCHASFVNVLVRKHVFNIFVKLTDDCFSLCNCSCFLCKIYLGYLVCKDG